MKLIYLLITLAVLHHPAYSQLNKGQWIVGGTAEYSSSNLDNSHSVGEVKTTNKMLEMSPGAGYFFIDRLAGGLRIAVIDNSFSQSTNSSFMPGYIYIAEAYSSNSAFGLSPFIRYYFLKPTKKVNLFADGSYMISFINTTTRLYEYIQSGPNPPSVSDSRSKSKNQAHNFTLAAGPAFFLNEKVALELTIGYSIGNYSEGDQSSQTVVLGAGFQIHLGKK
jgi:hypothetical protein